MKKFLLILLSIMLIGCGTKTESHDESKEDINKEEESEMSETTQVVDEEKSEEIPAEILDFEDFNSIHVIINKKHELPEDYEPEDLVEPEVKKIRESCPMREEAAQALKEMFEAAAKDGLDLMLVSGYRSYSYQKGLFDNYVARDGEEAANRYSARPGQSEHQTGLAADLGTSDQACLLMGCFKDTEAGKWLAENSYLFGFVLRYPEEKEEVTGYIYEPWHFRYIGLEQAYLVHESGLTLEEYYDYMD